MKSNESIKGRSISGFIWKTCERAGVQIVSMIVQIVLARLLLPEDYGLIGYVTVFMAIADVFLRQGFTTALIQRKNIEDLDTSTVFYANIIMSVILFFVFYVSAPFVSLFYSEPRLTGIMRVFSLNIIIGAFGAVHSALLQKGLEFRKSFFQGLSNIITFGVVSITMANKGFGTWSLIAGNMAGTLVGVVVLWITVHWRPKFLFSRKRLGVLFSFSSKVLGTNLLNSVFNNINPIIIGKYYLATDLGYYQRGQNIPQTIMTAIDGSMAEVMYPTLSILQDDLITLKQALRRSMKLSMYVCLPILAGLFVTAESLTIVLLTEKWLPSVRYMQLTCLICMFWPLSARTNALNAIGKSGLTFKISLICKGISLSVLLIMAKYGIIFILLGSIITSIISFFIVSYYVDRELHYSIYELLKDLSPIIFITILMSVIVSSVSLLGLSSLITLIIQVPFGIVLYVCCSVVFKIDSFKYIYDMIKKRFKGRISE